MTLYDVKCINCVEIHLIIRLNFNLRLDVYNVHQIKTVIRATKQASFMLTFYFISIVQKQVNETTTYEHDIIQVCPNIYKRYFSKHNKKTTVV